MKQVQYAFLAVVVITLAAGSARGQLYGAWGFGGVEDHSILAIKPDGTCALTNDSVLPRKTLEMQMKALERYSQAAESAGSEEENAPPASAEKAKPEAKKLTDAELAAKVRERAQDRHGFGGESTMEIDKVEVGTNFVRVLSRRSFASLKELFSEGQHTWAPQVLMIENARAEIDTNRNLRITFMASPTAARYSRDMSRAYKSAKMKFDWRLILPGKILSSGLPVSEGNQTSLSMDSDKPETIDAALKLAATTVVITAEAGGLKLDEPLESKTLARNAWRRSKAEPEVPITDAGPGFLAEPVGLTITTVHYFPNGKEGLKNGRGYSMSWAETSGTRVSAKLFPPKGRIIRSVSGLRVKSAKDDQGRAIKTSSDASGEEEGYSEFTYNSDGGEQGDSTRVELRLGLPAPDAKSIEQLECEAVAFTIGSWKELVLTNVQAATNKQIALDEVLPGAKLTVKKVSGKKPQTMVEARLEGPAQIGQLEVKIKMESRRGGSSSSSDRNTKTSGGKTTRDISIQAYDFEAGEGGKSGPPTLIVRYPQDMKRERVQFKLTTLDLL